MNFGDIITDDLADGRLVTAASENPEGINVVQDTANSPISRYSDVMKKELQNGYPALSDGTSLGYLFGAESYSKKMNNQSVDGLFQYDEVTGAYSFNSRTNFAQFNSGSDTFTLYDEIFTPNFIMYPFGNFMPFNDIVHDSKQVSQINESYFNELMLQANYLYQQGKGEEYAKLAKVLGQFMDYAKQDGWGDNWTAERALQHYFYWGSELPDPDDNENNFNQISLDRLYSLDYDVESDFYFGMEMKMNFLQPKGGLTGKDGKQPMVFYFTGDDDVWVYIDGKLFLDLSGIHRHVGGEIDFVNGVVKYYSLDTKTGDVSSTPYKTVTFSEILGSNAGLNANGTFNDYTTHSFSFYYMERGSGSSVCRLNFNFPLLKKNSISVSKELTVDEQDKLALLGNPDFCFQVLKADKDGNKTGDLFIAPGTSYDIYDSSNEKVGTGTTDANGVFTLKAGQRAEFTGIAENSGKYYVRELLDPNAFAQYGTISVDGSSQTTNYDVTIGTDQFKGLDSTVKDVSDGTTMFHFNNQVTFKKLGSLEISKVLNAYPQTRAVASFDFEVTLDGVALPVGTAYTVGGESRTVETAGIITVPAGATAKISNILAGAKFTVKETAASSAGYTVTYSGDGVTTDGQSASGTIRVNTSVGVTVANHEKGASVTIPVNKTISNPDGAQHTFSFKLEQVTNQEGATLVEGGTVQEMSISVENSESGAFTLIYLEKNINQLPATFYYRITEVTDDRLIGFDPSAYVAEITVTNVSNELKAEMTRLWKNGTEVTGQTLQVSFTNTLLRNLTIQKRVVGIATEEKFQFELTLMDGNVPLSGSYKTLENETPGNVNFENGKASFQLGADETITIYGLPYGVTWTVLESGTAGYHVTWQIGNTTQEGSSASGTLNDNHIIVCTNQGTYELPETGGSGTTLYTWGGLLLCGGAYLLYKHTKRRREGIPS